MAMDWANEWWVRLYTRDTTTWKLLAWEARSVLMHMLRKVDRAGVLEVGDDGVLGLAAILDMPEDVVAAHLPALLKRGAVELVGTSYILPNFIDAQETPSSDRQRQRVSRENRRDRARGDSVTKRDGSSQNVTECHAPSRGVTNGHSEREEREEREETKEEPAAPALALALDIPAPIKPPDAVQVATVAAIARLNLKTGRRFDAGAASVAKDVRACLKAGLTADDLFTIIDDRCAAWLDSPKRDELLKPSVLFRPSNAQRYLAESRAGPTTTAPRATGHATTTFRRITEEEITR